MSKNRVSIPLVGGQGDLLDIDGEQFIIESPTDATHYLTLQSVEDPDQHEQFATAADFTQWWSVRNEFSITRARAHDLEPATAPDEEPDTEETEAEA